MTTLRIIKKPTRVLPKLGEHGSNTTHPILIFSCNDGCDYTLVKLAERIGMSKQKLVYQIKVLGWKHPRALDPDYRKLPAPSKMRGNAAWQKLSDKPRFARLENLAPTGSLEQRCA